MTITVFDFEKSPDRFEVGHKAVKKSSLSTDIKKPDSLTLVWDNEENKSRYLQEVESLLFKESKIEQVAPQKQNYPCKIVSIFEDEVECMLELEDQSSTGFIPKSIFVENEIPIRSGQMFNIVFENVYGRRVMQMESVFPKISEKKRQVLNLIDSL